MIVCLSHASSQSAEAAHRKQAEREKSERASFNTGPSEAAAAEATGASPDRQRVRKPTAEFDAELRRRSSAR